MINKHPKIRLNIVFVLNLVIFNINCTFSNLTEAQTITLNTTLTNFTDSDEYFTDVFAKPKNFNSVCDLGRDSFKYSPKFSSGGVVTATHRLVKGPLFQVLPIPALGTNIVASREDCNELGLDGNKRLDTSKYSRLAYRIKNSGPSSSSFLWSKENNYAIDGFSDYDGLFTSIGGVPTLANQWVIKSFDIKQRAPSSNPWTGYVKGLSLWPSFYQAPGGTTSLDWLRIFDPNNSPQIPLSWNTSNYSAADGDRVAIYADTDAVGYDGQFIVRDLPLNGSTNLLSGILAPGQYYLYAQVERDIGSGFSILARSSYSSIITINAKPLLKFTSPSRMSGAEYFRDEVGNAADMSDNADVTNMNAPVAERGYDNGRIENGIFFANVTPDPNQNNEFTTIDTQVYLSAKVEKPVDTNKYRFFCYRMQVDSVKLSRDGNLANQSRDGWVSRLRWMRKALATSTFGTTAAHEIVEASTTFPDLANGFVTYCFDLWDSRGQEEGTSWKNARFVDIIGLDPLEAVYDTKFAIDWAGLYAENRESANGIFNISWNLTDSDSSNMQVKLFTDNDAEGFNGSEIATLNNQSTGSGSYSWNTTGLASGTYYIYAEIRDAEGNLAKYYSSEPVRVNSPLSTFSPVHTPCDFDGDGKSDYAVARGSSAGGSNAGDATIYTAKSAVGSTVSVQTGNVQKDTFIDQDIDGDLISDIQFVRVNEPSVGYRWFTTHSSAPWITTAVQRGAYGSIPIAARFSGPGGTKSGSFLNGVWSYADLNNVPYTANWGRAGDIPVPADYDGDGIDNIAVFRPSDGNWYIITNTGAVIQRFWGAFGDIPVAGDYDADGKEDIAVWRPSDAVWYVCYAKNGFECWGRDNYKVQFGLPNDFPIEGDFNGDGKRDPAVFRQSTGYWYVLEDGKVITKQFGLPNDRPICAALYKNYLTQPKYVAPVVKPTPKPTKKPIKRPVRR